MNTLKVSEKDCVTRALRSLRDKQFNTEGTRERLKVLDSLGRIELKYNPYGDKRSMLDGYRLDVNGIVNKGQILTHKDCEFLTKGSSSPYHIGVELEVEGISDENRYDIAEALDQHLWESHVVTYDGSLDSSGGEIVTSPLASRRFDQVRWYRLLRQLSRLGLKSHDSPRCGLHVHISRDYLKESTWLAVQRFLLRYKAFFKAISRRRGTDPFYYCQFVRDRQAKYRAMNFLHSKTIEFRFLHGTLNPLTFLAGVNAIRALVETAKDAETCGKRLTVRAYRERLLDSFACRMRYAEAINNYLDSRRAESVSEGGTRPRRTEAQILSETESALRRVMDLSGRDLWIASGRINVDLSNYYWLAGTFRDRINHEIPVPYTYDVRFSRFPARLRRDLQRLGVTKIVVTSKVQTRASEVSLNYYRGSYGRNSQCVLSM